MDRIGIFAMGAALVLASALHMMAVPTWLVALPMALFVAGVVRVLVVGGADDTRPKLSRSTAAEA